MRWGGEEFLLVLNGCDRSEARRIAENPLQKVAATPIEVEGQAIAVTMSVGVSHYAGSERIDQAVSRADAALYAAKKGGRNRVEVSPDMA